MEVGTMLCCVKRFCFIMALPWVTCEVPCREFMTIKVSDPLRSFWPDGMMFDVDQLMIGLPSGVMTAAGTHSSTAEQLCKMSGNLAFYKHLLANIYKFSLFLILTGVLSYLYI